MKIKFSIGPASESDKKNMSITTNFFYVSTTDSGITGNNQVAPSKLQNPIEVSTNEEYKSKIVSLLNFESYSQDNILLSTAVEGLCNIDQNIYYVSVYKKEIWYDRNTGNSHEEPLWTPVSINTNYPIIRDYNVKNNRTYKYVFRPVLRNIDGASVEDISGKIYVVKTKWQGWSITELHPTNDSLVFTASPMDVWKFKYNISSGQQTQNVSKTQQDTLARFPVFSHGPKNAIGGNVSCLLGREITNANYTEYHYEYKYNEFSQKWEWTAERGGVENLGGYRETLNRNGNSCNKSASYVSASDLGFPELTSNEAVDMLDAWRNVCYSGNPKLLKDEKGQSFIIQIFNPNNTTNEMWNGRPEEISFDWVQIDDPKKYRIVQETTRN